VVDSDSWNHSIASSALLGRVGKVRDETKRLL
jgi:hypothetical protein